MRELNTNEREKLIDLVFETMGDNEIVDLHNDACDNNNDWDSRIYENEEHTLNEMFSSVSEFARSSFYGDYDFNHGYFRFNGYGNIESFSDWDLRDYIEEDYIIDGIESGDIDIDQHTTSIDIVEFLEAIEEEEEE